MLKFLLLIQALFVFSLVEKVEKKNNEKITTTKKFSKARHSTINVKRAEEREY